MVIFTKEKKAYQRAYRKHNGDAEAMNRDAALHAAPSAKTEAEARLKEAETARDKITKRLSKTKKALSDETSRLKGMHLQNEIVSIEAHLGRLNNDYTNAARALQDVERNANDARIQYYKHKNGAEFLEAKGRKKRLEATVATLRPHESDPEIKATIIEKEALIRGFDKLHTDALNEWADTYYHLTGTDIEAEGEPEERNEKHKDPDMRGVLRQLGSCQ